MVNNISSIYKFGDFSLRASEMCVWRGEEILPLAPKAVETLLVLILGNGQLVTKDVLMQTIWNDTFVEETGLTRNISVLRKALGDTDKNNPRFILTLPKRGYRFIAKVTIIETETFARANSIDLLPTLAVLPFRNFNAEAKDDYLGLGLADALITRLSNVHQLIVRPTGAVHHYYSTVADPLEIGKTLGVEYVLDGGILNTNDGRTRITVQLLSVSQSCLLWGEKFDEDAVDILSLQDSLSERVAITIVKKLSKSERTALEKKPTIHEEAYQNYLQGRFHWNKRTAEHLQKAVKYFERAVKLDPNFALAYAALSETYVLFSEHFILSPHETLHLAESAASSALALDKTLAEAHTTLAQIAYIYYWDWNRAEATFRHAISLNPNYANTHHWFALFLGAIRRFDESLAEFDKALKLDPLSLIINRNLALTLTFKGDYEKAYHQSQKVIELDPDFALAYLGYAFVLLKIGQVDEAIAAIERGCNLSDRSPNFLSSLAVTYNRAKQHKKAENILCEMLESAKTTPVPAVEFALVYANLGNLDEAFEWLEKSYQEREPHLYTIIIDSDFSPFWKDSRFHSFVQRMNLESIFYR